MNQNYEDGMHTSLDQKCVLADLFILFRVILFHYHLMHLIWVLGYFSNDEQHSIQYYDSNHE